MKTPMRIPLALSILLLSAGMAQGEDKGAYGYFRVLDGSATLIQVDTGAREEVEVNQPVVEGDTLWMAPGGRVEVVLSDESRLRADGRTELVFQKLSGPADRSTVLQLRQGNLQWVLPVDPPAEGAPRIDTDNATIYLHAAGSYRVTTEDGGWTQVVVRQGYAEVLTPQGSTIVRADEQVRVDGYDQARIRVTSAPSLDSLERWGEEQESRRTSSTSARYMDGQLGYSSAVLDDYGSWLVLDGQRAWRPRVSVGWRPYWNGRWAYGSVGLSWISSEPWGWVPHHYGTWDHRSGYGWVWYPGHVYSPARVHWYWGSGYFGWIPSGYYGRYYGWGLRSGVYGWAGGTWGQYNRWTFSSTRYLGSRNQQAHFRSGRTMGSELHTANIGRGLITTDTRGIKPGRWHEPKDVLASLRDGRGVGNRELPDVTDFVERRRDLDPRVRDRVQPKHDTPNVDRPETDRRGSGSDHVARTTPETPRARVDERPAGIRNEDRRTSSDRRGDWRTSHDDRDVARVDKGGTNPPRVEGRDHQSVTDHRIRPDERSETSHRVTPNHRNDRDRETDAGATERTRIEPRHQPPRGDRPDWRDEPENRGEDRPTIVDRGSRDRPTSDRPSNDWRQGDRSHTQGSWPGDHERVLGTRPTTTPPRGDDVRRVTDRPTHGNEASRSWRSQGSTGNETPVVRRVLDSIRSGSGTSAARGSSAGYGSRYESRSSESPRYEVNRSRSESGYRSSSGRESRPSRASSSGSDNGRSKSSSVRGSDRARSGSSVKSRTSSSSRSSSSRSSSSRSKSSRSSSKRHEGRG